MTEKIDLNKYQDFVQAVTSNPSNDIEAFIFLGNIKSEGKNATVGGPSATGTGATNGAAGADGSAAPNLPVAHYSDNHAHYNYPTGSDAPHASISAPALPHGYLESVIAPKESHIHRWVHGGLRRGAGSVDLLPVAEECGVVLAMHPDDPPLASLLGKPRIMHSVEAFERLVRLAPSPSNAICFCQGSFASMNVDIPATIRRLGPWIRYVHFRDVAGTPQDFAETFHDNGPTDMAAAMRAYHEIGFTGAMRPDHVPQLLGEDDGEPGYTMLGRLFAWGYMRGLMQATSGSGQ